MIKRYLLILVFIATAVVAYSQKSGSVDEVPKHRFGIGVGYSLKSIFEEKVRPFEVSFKYQLQGKHTMYLRLPFDQYLRRSNDNESQAYKKWRRNMLGIGVGYNYAIPIYKFISCFAGGEFSYAKFRQTDYHKIFELKNKEYDLIYMEHNRVVSQNYSFIPNAGLRCSYRHWEAEMKYEIYLTKMKRYEFWSHKENGTHRGHIVVPEHIFKTVGILNFNLSYYF